jgi:hypothetical protein
MEPLARNPDHLIHLPHCDNINGERQPPVA